MSKEIVGLIAEVADVSHPSDSNSGTPQFIMKLIFLQRMHIVRCIVGQSLSPTAAIGSKDPQGLRFEASNGSRGVK